MESNNGWKHYDLTIKHGQVYEYKRKKGEKLIGIVSKGESHRKKVSFRIINEDAGKSPELMRYLMEGDSEKRSFSQILMIGASLLGFIVIGVFIFSMIGKEEPQQENTLQVTTQTQRDLFDNIENSNEPVLVQEEPQEVQEPIIQQPVINPVQNLQNDYEIQSLRVQILQKDSEYSILEKKYFSEQSERQELELKNQELGGLNENLLSKVRGLELELIKVQKESAQTGSDEFLLYLGEQVRETCENAVTEDKKRSCSDLYFNFLK